MAKRIYTLNNYVVVDNDDSSPLSYLSKRGFDFRERANDLLIYNSGASLSLDQSILISDIPNWYAEDGVTAYTKESLISFLTQNTGFSEAGDSSAVTTTNFGFMDYNDTSPIIPLVADTWTTLPNNGLGAFTNKAYKPSLVNEIIDTSNGHLDFSDLTLGSEIGIRNDFTVVPNTNNALLEARYLLGGGAGQYPLEFVSERLSSGSGISYQRVRLFSIYMGDNNTLLNQGILQVKLSTAGTVDNAGSYISIKVR